MYTEKIKNGYDLKRKNQIDTDRVYRTKFFVPFPKCFTLYSSNSKKGELLNKCSP